MSIYIVFLGGACIFQVHVLIAIYLESNCVRERPTCIGARPKCAAASINAMQQDWLCADDIGGVGAIL